jgi:DNA-binding CsgD family transcriptional regulator
MPTGLSSPHLVGREIETERLVDALDAAKESHPTLTLIIGEAGVGKTRLAREAAKQAADRGILVLRGECVELSGGEFPYAPVAGALRDLEPSDLDEALTKLPTRARLELARVFPDIVGEPAGPGLNGDQFPQTRVFAWLLSLLRQLSERVPILLAVEDLQLADASSRDFLRFLALNMRAERIGVIATVRGDELHRDHPVRRLVAELTRSEHVHRMDLAPLSLEQVAQQVAEILEEDPPAALVRRLFARSEGNPFYTEELLAAHQADIDALPSTLRDALLLRVESRSDSAQAVARLVSAVGRPVPHRVLQTAGRLAWPELDLALRECVDHHLLVCDRETDAYRFRHALLREAVYDDLLPSQRTALHRSIAQALEQARGTVTAAECAYHWDAAGEPGRALRWLVEAGSDAERRFAHSEAFTHFGRALELWPTVESVDAGIDLVGLLAQAAEAARWTGNFARAKELCEQALRCFEHDSDRARAAALYERLGRYQPWNVEGSLAAYDCALKLLPEEKTAERVRLQVNQAYALTFLGRWQEAKAKAEQVLEEAESEPLLWEQGSARAVLGVAIAFLGDLAGGEGQLRHALQLAERTDDAEAIGQIHLDLGEVLRLQGRTEAALQVMRDGERLAARYGAGGLYGAFMAVNAADDLFRLGRWDEVEARIRELDRRQLGPTAELLISTVAGRLDTARGRFKSAAERLERAVELTREAALLEFIPTVHAAYAELELWRNATGRARAQIAAGLESIGETADALHLPALYSMGARVEADRAEEARSRGDKIEPGDARQAAAGHCESLANLLESTRSGVKPPEAEAHLASCYAELSRASGHSSPERWARAVELWSGLDRPYASAYASYRHAEALIGRASERQQAQRAITEAARLSGDLSAEPLRARIGALARAARLTLSSEGGPGGVAPEAISERNAFDLTDRELQVLSLMAAGLTNREIAERLYISQKTAGVHVSHILAKLGVANRVMAAAVAQRLGLSPPG